MSSSLALVLLIIFLVHLVAFGVLGLRRRQGYYAALVLTFALLSAALATRLIAPGIELGGVEVSRALRWAAWPAAAVSIGWTLLRLWQRWRRPAE